MTVCVIGLGIMGGAYARNLLGAGEAVIGVDPLEAARQSVPGAQTYAEPGAWISSCDLIVLSLVSPVVLESVADALCAFVKPGQVIVETGTFALADKRKAQDILARVGAVLLDCPVSGTGTQAASGDLVMMVSGPTREVSIARPILEKFTRLIIEAGEFGNGTKLKFVANHAVALHNVAAAETLNYADRLNLDRDTVFEMLSRGAGQSRMSDLRMPLMMSGGYEPPSANMKMFEKDLSAIGEDIAEKGVQAPLFDAARALYETAFEALPPTVDTAAVFEVYRKNLGH
ncbi:NAD(P)-dependent oxidoreductase [Roseibium sp.]|uniref:NAD(P)-dependent oxidoreductase n=1 Tax=Roseibium sp. TaxID=1936156 RepID=UPI003266DB86